jgi:hypothetical protein
MTKIERFVKKIEDRYGEFAPEGRIPNGTAVVAKNSKTGHETRGTIATANADSERVWWYFILAEDGTLHEALPSIVTVVK